MRYLELTKRVEKIVVAGWDAELSSSVTEEQNLEALVHEMAHSWVLGNFSPKNMASTNKMILRAYPHLSYEERANQNDSDEILTTAVTIQLLETHYGIKGDVINDALYSVSMNVRKVNTALAADMTIELLGTDRVNSLVAQIVQYIEGL